MTVQVRIGTSSVSIERRVFELLFENSVAYTRAPLQHALESSTIRFHDLIDLARVADIPYSLFFAPYDHVAAQVATKTTKLLQGLTKESFSLKARHTVRLRDIELILKDLVRKQQLLKQHDPSLTANKIVGVLRVAGRTPAEDASELSKALGLTAETLRSASTKEIAASRLIRLLESNQILVAQSQSNFMPQRLRNADLSGITVRDPKVPYIFIAGGGEGEDLEPAGRRVFTLMLLTVLVARGVFAPVNYDSTAIAVSKSHEYDVTAQLLMPADELKQAPPRSLRDVRELAESFKVTPSAVAVRCLRLRLLDYETANSFLNELALEFRERPKPRLSTPKPTNAVRKYCGRELSWRMLRAVDDGRISPAEFCRAVTLRKLKPSDLDEFRAGLK